MDRSPDLVLDPRSTARFLGAIVLVLLAAHVAGLVAEYAFGRDTLLGLGPLFDFDQERNVPTLFSAGLFLVAAALLALVARVHRAARRPFGVWYVLGALACFLAVDEVAGIHEMFAGPLRESLHTHGFLRHAWVIPYGIGAVSVAALLVPMLRRLSPGDRGRFLGAGTVYVAGAVGLEMVGGRYQELAGVTRDPVYEAISTVEETLEMAGLVLAVRALVALLGGDGVRIVIPSGAVADVAPPGRVAPGTPAPEPAATRPRPGAPRPTPVDPAQNMR